MIKTGKKVDSVVSVRELLSLLGGIYSSLIDVKHKGNLVETLNKEPAKSVSRRDFPVMREDADLEEVLETLILGERGYVVVLDKEDNIVGLITDRDIIEFFKEKKVGIRVSDVMSSQLVTMKHISSLCEVIREMNILNIRRIPLVREDGSVSGIVLARDIINFIGSHTVFKYITTGLYEEFCKLPSALVAREIATINPEADIGEASEKMLSQKIDYLLVASRDEIHGIVTERDIIYGYVVLSRF
ncbi:MAG: CBS domain-containing protein [Sulfolobales archaeon]